MGFILRIRLMTVIMIKMLTLLILLMPAGTIANPVPHRTYFIEIHGEQQTKEALLKKITAKPCFKLADIKGGTTVTDCYAFVPASKNQKLIGPNEFLFKIRMKSINSANKSKVISVQGFKSNGNRLVRYFNPGNFSVPSVHESQFIQQTADRIITLAFK